MVGKRRRTVYTITAKGRRAPQDLVGDTRRTNPAESEQLLQIFFAEHGTTENAHATIAEIRSWAHERADENVAVARSYLAGTGPFPERAAVLALTGRFMTDYIEMVARWADWAETVVASWPDDPRLAEPDWATYRDIAHETPAPARSHRPSGRKRQ